MPIPPCSSISSLSSLSPSPVSSSFSEWDFQRSESPCLDPTREYDDQERLNFALASWHAKKKRVEEEKLAKTTHIPDPSAADIARLYDVNVRTFQRHIQKPNTQTRFQQHKTMQKLSEAQEAALVGRLRYLEEWNIPADRAQTVILAEALLKSTKTEASDSSTEPLVSLGKDWFYRFRSRHADEVKFVFTQNKDKSRCNAEDWDLIDDFYWKYRKAREKYNLIGDDKTRYIWNMDEKPFRMGIAARKKRIVSTSSRNPAYKEHTNRESCTVLETCSAEGVFLIPAVIWKSVAGHLCEWYQEETAENYWYGYSEKGFNNRGIMIEYLRKVFEPSTRPDDPGQWRMLIYDGFEAHLGYEVIEFLLSHHIIAFCLPAHSSHRTQPLDVGVFSSLSSAYKNEVSKRKQVVKKKTFPHLLSLARQQGCTAQNAKAGFRKCGLIPYNPSRVLELCRPLREPTPLPNTAIQSNYSQSIQGAQAPHQPEQDLLQFSCSPPTTPRRQESLYREAVDLTTTSPRSYKLRTALTAFRTALEIQTATTKMAEEGERHLQESILTERQQTVTNRRRVPQADGTLKKSGNSESTVGAQVLEQGNILVKRKKERDEEEEEKKAKKRQARVKPPASTSAPTSYDSEQIEIAHGDFRSWV